MSEKKLSHQEYLKLNSLGLQGNIAADLSGPEAFVSDDSYELLKFHGSYQGYNRDTATPRKKQGLDKEWEFMLRLKMPGGRLTAAQYLALDALCDQHANGTLRITTRQTFQFHCIVKSHLKPFIADVNSVLLSTLGGCGDVVRNVITCPAPVHDDIHKTLEDQCYALATHFAPRSSGYYELWLDGEHMRDYPFQLPALPKEPVYGSAYMPRKFKIAIGQPEDNCMDLLCNDLALLALFEGQTLRGYNIAIGGGLGMKHTNPRTFPYLAKPVAFVPPSGLLAASEAVVALQRDFGDRSDRQHARLKYLVEERGLAWCREQLEHTLGTSLASPYAVSRWHVEDHMGWHPQHNGRWFYGISIPSGRIQDTEKEAYRSAIRAIVRTYNTAVILTNDQNLIVAGIDEREKPAFEAILQMHGAPLRQHRTELSRYMLACVALPTCGKALAEAERVQPDIEHILSQLLAQHGLQDLRISVRIAGCPNGCSRPYVGDIGIVGRTPDHYAIYIGGDFEGTRLNEKLFEKVPFAALRLALDPFFAYYSSHRQLHERLNDFCQRIGLPGVKRYIREHLSPLPDWAA